MNAESADLLILGASTRAAAWSAWRAGFLPVCGDAFADEDLRTVATILPVANYPHGLIDAVRSVPTCPWMYTGAMENHPAIVERVSASRPLWGNPPNVLRRIRDPFAVQQILKQASFPVLPVVPPQAPPPADGRWLLKPRRSAAGRGICVWFGEHALSERPDSRPDEYYFQRRAEGVSLSGLFLGLPGRVELLGIAEQWIGNAGPGGSPFAYCGSLVPATPPAAVCGQIRSIGEVLGVTCGLRGLFGCDFVCNAATAWLVEVNPRYTASVEVFERAFDVALLGWHCRSCAVFESGDASQMRRIEDDLDRGLVVLAQPADRIFGKRIVYAPQEWNAPRLGLVRTSGSASKWPEVADIPTAGTRIGPGHPICTVFADAENSASCRVLLERRAVQIAGNGTGETGCS